MNLSEKPDTWGNLANNLDALHKAYRDGKQEGLREAKKQAETEIGAEALWQWVRFDSTDGLTEWMPAKRSGNYWSSVGWGNCIPEVYGPLIFTPKESI